MTVSDTVDSSVQEELIRRGHQLESSAGAIATPVMLAIDQESRMLYAAGDPAANRHAAGLDDE